MLNALPLHALPPTAVILTHFQAATLLDARKEGRKEAEISLDIGLTQSLVSVIEEGVAFPDGQHLNWDTIARIKKNDVACYLVADNAAEKIQFYSAFLRRFYSLRPTDGAPTMLIAGFPMHRIKDIDPREDTVRKIRTISPMTGQVLDTTTGLGYTAIEAAKTASHVTTVELDPTAIKVASNNPWSRDLFDNPKIEQLIGDSTKLIKTMPDMAFDRIIHDPPTLALGGDLYSGVFYGELYRVLKKNGKLYHYIGDLESRTGRGVAKGAARRLQDAGFTKVIKHLESFGLVCTK